MEWLRPPIAMGGPNQGDRVRINASTPEGSVTHEGILLAPATGGHVTVKLDNGYNVTFQQSEISDMELIAAGSEVETRLQSTPSENPDLPEVWILHTGGTIASKVDYVTGAVAARFEPEELLDAVPELAQHARIRAKKLGNMWSDDIRPSLHSNGVAEYRQTTCCPVSLLGFVHAEQVRA